MQNKTKYFPHIDGLRAFAVIAVILFHYKIPGFSGGFSGVDIFFVISGFLITGIIHNKLYNNNFSFIGFYKKRFYRIYPALLFVSIVTFIAAVILFSPKHLENLSYSMLGALSFVSNIIYWKSIGYFQILDSYDPFVPTWSLSIELQYYLLFPPFYILITKIFKDKTKWIMLIGIVASLALSEIFLRFTNNFVYYNLPFRFFEFGIGSLCYYILQSPIIKKLNGMAFAFIPFIGTIMIVSGFILLSDQTPFPGIWALVPCVGAALIILSNDDNNGIIHKIYDNRVSIYIGKISYSLYLIHWPLYVIFAYWYYSEIGILIKLKLVIISLILAAVIHHFIENSYRRKDIGIKKQAILFSSTFLVFIFAYNVTSNNGWSWRLSDVQKELLYHIEKEDKKFKIAFDKKFPMPEEKEFIASKHSGLECSYNNTKNYEILIPCLEHNLTSKSDKGFLIIGDSNGANTYKALELAYPNQSFAMLQQAGCAATSYLKDRRSGSWCFKDLQKILQELDKKQIVKAIILSSRWVLEPYERLNNDINYYNKNVLIIGPTPMLRHDIFETFFMLGAKNYEDVQNLPLQEPYFYDDTLKAENFLSHNLPNVTYISKIKLLCPEYICPVFIENGKKPLFLDDQHLSSAGIKYLSNLLKNSNDMKKFIEKSTIIKNIE